MRVPGVKTAKTFSRWVRARLLGGALILGYHRVANATSDDFEVCVTPKHFSEQMDALKKYAHPINLADLVQHLREGSVPAKSVAVTFDDGYADNLYEAKPILEKLAIPATVFVCTGYAGEEFWWDELERLVTLSQAELGALQLEVGRRQFAWGQPEMSRETGFASRRKFRHMLYSFLLALDAEDQIQAMDMIRSWANVPSNETTVRAMTHEEILQLVGGGLIEIGAHTRHHPMLPRLALQRQREEIVASKQDLENLLGKRVDGFAYPNGTATKDAKQIVHEAGFAFACTSLHDVVRPASDLHALTRFWQTDVDGEKFLRGLHLWTKGGQA